MPKSSYPAKLENLNDMLGFILGYASEQGFDDKKAGKIRLAMEEILVNIISYAYPEKSGSIDIDCSPAEGDKTGITIEVKDLGVPFNMLEKEDPDITLPMEDRQIGGLGIFFAKQIMDSLTYERSGNANILRLTKYE
ncbi:MAG: ATP-binding protein [Candidatus Riflebacteria bacterium HGW-Riflebacteria-2]|jgi:anti-sigma regulatory factor (Ser/Thr protein kinase)|nr:MAG: ATP-binding protein [Candidatus Riflebacteria bacterium HGW-Riflebacteria-2]